MFGLYIAENDDLFFIHTYKDISPLSDEYFSGNFISMGIFDVCFIELVLHLASSW